MDTIIKLLTKLCCFVGKIVCKAIWWICKSVWKTGRSSYQMYREKKAVGKGRSDGVAATSEEVVGPDESVRITGKEKFENYTDDELRSLYEKMMENGAKVDAHPELEKLLETYGADQENFKQEITDELKRREMLRKD